MLLWFKVRATFFPLQKLLQSLYLKGVGTQSSLVIPSGFTDRLILNLYLIRLLVTVTNPFGLLHSSLGLLVVMSFGLLYLSLLSVCTGLLSSNPLRFKSFVLYCSVVLSRLLLTIDLAF